MKKHLSSLLLFIAALLWGLAFTAQKQAAEVPTFTLGATRNIVATLFLLIVTVPFDKLRKNGRSLIKNRRPDYTKYEIVGGILCGAVLTFASAFQQYGIGSGTDAGKAAFITALYVAIVPFIGLFMKRRSPLRVWIGVGIAVVGFYLLCINESLTIDPADALVLVCAFIFALHITVVDHYSPKCDGIRLATIQFFSCFIFNTGIALLMEFPIRTDLVAACLPALLYLGICSSGIAYTLQILGQKDANPAVAGIIMSLESVFGVLGAAVLTGEILEPREYLGCVIVFIAVILSELDISAFKKKGQKHSDTIPKDTST